jgi:hypothetical protein
MKNSFQLLSLVVCLLCCTAVQKVYAQDLVEDSVKYGAGKVYLNPENTASFAGGNDRMLDYLNLKFDQFDDGTTDYRSRMSGLIKASFVVETNGKIKYVYIIEGVSSSLDEYMVKAIRTMPKWIPATEAGQKVRSLEMLRYDVSGFRQ